MIERVTCFPNEGTPEVIPGDPVDGDIIRIDGKVYQRYTAPIPPAPQPRVLSKTAFQDYAISQLGGGTTGMGRFTEIMGSTRDSSSGSVRFCFARYEAAMTFEKTNTATLTQIMAGDSSLGHLTAGERTSILDNWPTQ